MELIEQLKTCATMQSCVSCPHMQEGCNFKKLALRIAGRVREMTDFNVEMAKANSDLLDKTVELKKRVNELEAQVPKQGEWKVDKSHFSPHIICSNCGVDIPCVAGWCMDAHINYCPNCGAKMGGTDADSTAHNPS